MAKKKKNNKARQVAGGSAGALSEPAGEELEEGSPEWLEQQRRLFEQFESKAQKETNASITRALESVNVGQSAENSPEAVIENQRRLLESAKNKSQGGESACLHGLDMGMAGAEAESEVFAVRRVPFCGRQVPMLMQNRNGPCALLAVANGLLLRGTLRLSDGQDSMSSKDLVNRLALLCEALNAKQIAEDANVRASIRQVIERLPKLLDGLVLNCRFGSCSDFEYTADLALFDYFNLQLYHTWVEPNVAAVANSWNALAELLAVSSEIRGVLERERRLPTQSEDEKLAQAIWLEEWLEETRSQATEQGIRQLVESMHENEVCVLFRNNHFSTVFKPRAEAVCALLTDVSFESTASAIWESLEVDCSGAGSILDGSFQPGDGSVQPAKGTSIGAGRLDAKRMQLIFAVKELGFTQDQAEAGLTVVNWSSAEEAVEAILDGTAEASAGGGSTRPAHSSNSSRRHICPSCGKEFKSVNGKLNHQAAKGH